MQNLYNKGQLGHSDTKGVEAPKQVMAMADKHVTKLSCGGYHTLVSTTQNQLFAFGSNQYGECGNGNNAVNYLIPVRVDLPLPEESENEDHRDRDPTINLR